jgi:outer membrane protein
MTKMVSGLLVLALGVGTASVRAQDLPTLTLEEALDIARDRNPSYLTAIAQADASGASVRQQYGAFFPSLSLSMGWNGSSRTSLSAEDEFGQTVTLPDPVSVRGSSASQGFSASWTLFDGLRNVNSLGAAKFNLAAAHAGADYQGINVDAEVSQRFYQAVREQRLVEVEEQLLTSAQERLSANERLFRVASVSQVDVLGARVDLASAQQQLDVQLASARKARLQVLQSLGILGEIDDFTLEGGFPPVFDPETLTIDDLVQRAFEANPVVAQREFQYESARKSSAAARGAWLPSLSFNGGWSRGQQNQGFGAVFDFDPGQNRGYSFGISVNWQAFDGFQRSQAIASANSQARQAQETLRLESLQLEQAVRAAFIDLQTAHSGLDLQRRATELSRQRIEFAQEQYREGAIDFTSLQQIIDNGAQQERSLVNAEFNFANQLVLLEQQVGEPVRPQG